MKFQIIFLCSLFILGIHSKPDGAPDSTCDSMSVSHNGAVPQTSPSPYEFSIEENNDDTWSVNLVISEDYEVSDYKFKGFIIEARDIDNDEQVGTFSWDGVYDDDYHFMDCSDDFPNAAVTHSNNDYKEMVELTFERDAFEGDFYFQATVVKDHDNYWEEITALKDEENSATGIQGTFFVIITAFIAKFIF